MTLFLLYCIDHPHADSVIIRTEYFGLIAHHRTRHRILFLGLLPGNVSGGFSARGVLNPVFLVLWLPMLLYVICPALERN